MQVSSIVKGVFNQPLNNTIIYQKSIPVTFIVDIPKFDTKIQKSPCKSCVKLESIHDAVLEATFRQQP